MKTIVFSHLLVLACATCVLGSSLTQKSGWQPPAGHTEAPIWPGGVPDAKSAAGPEIDTTTSKEPLVAGKPVVRLGNVASPTITLYAPKDQNTGAALVVFPGGGYRILAIDLEGTEVCDWLSSSGITCVLLKYRVPDSGPYPKSPAALEDAQRTLGLVRSHAAEWHIDPHRIGVLGFSAGAHLAAALSTHFDQRLYKSVDAADQISCRPDFAVIVYPGYLALPEQNHAQPCDPCHQTDTAHVPRSDGGRSSGPRGKLPYLLCRSEKSRRPGRDAPLQRGSSWVWSSTHASSRHTMASIGRDLASYDQDAPGVIVRVVPVSIHAEGPECIAAVAITYHRNRACRFAAD